MRFYAKAKEININSPAIIMLLMAFRFVFARLHREKEYRLVGRGENFYWNL